MIHPSRVPPVSRASTGSSLGTGSSGMSSLRDTSRTGVSSSGGASALLVALDSSSRQKVLARSDGSGEGQGSNRSGGESGGTASESTAAVDTAIRTDSAGLEAARSAIDNDTAGLDAVRAVVEKNLTDLASNPEKFHAVLEKSFGNRYDRAAAEVIRQQVQHGDFSWMPKLQVVDAASLQDQSGQQAVGTALGAYSRDNDTIYISRELLAGDPSMAARILTEEVGHALDARLNVADAAGDEGDIFSRLVNGEDIASAELKALKSENDSGTIIVDGKEVEVEYGFFSKITKPFKKAFRSLKKGLSNIWNGIKSGFRKLMSSKLFNTILTIAQFLPIPIVQVVVRGINLIKAGYALYQGIKHKSIGAVFSGVAGVASGVGGFGAAFGASPAFINTSMRIANGARAFSAGYSALAKGDFASAASLASNWFGGADTQAGRFLDRAGKVVNTVERARRGDVVGVLSSGADTLSSFSRGELRSADANSTIAVSQGASGTGGSRPGILSLIQELKNNSTVRSIGENISTVRTIVESVREGEFSSAASRFLNRYGDALGVDTSTRRSIERWSSVFEKVDGTRSAFRNGDFPQAIDDTAGLLGIPLTRLNQNRINVAFGIRDAIRQERYPDALRLAATLSTSYGKAELANTFLSVLTGLGIDPTAGQSSSLPNGGIAQGEAA